jgi:hypothetical protein
MKPDMSLLDELTAYGRICEIQRETLKEARLGRAEDMSFVAISYAIDDEETRLEGRGKTPMEALTDLAKAARVFYQGDYSYLQSVAKDVSDRFGVDSFFKTEKN